MPPLTLTTMIDKKKCAEPKNNQGGQAAPPGKEHRRMTTQEAFQKNLAMYVKQSGCTQIEIAERARIGRGTFAQLIYGHNGPQLETAWRLACALGVTLNDMVKGADE